MIKKIHLGVLLLAISFSVNAWQVGDTAYVYARNVGQTTLFSRDFVYYAKVSLEQLVEDKAKIHIEKICWLDTNSDIHCKLSGEGGFCPGNSTWVFTSNLYYRIPQD